MARPYSQDSDLNMDPRRLIELTDSDAAPGVLGQGVLDASKVDADDLIDDMLRGVYAVPLDVVPGIIKRISVRLRRVFLYEHRESIEMPATVRDGGKWALDMLDKLSTPDGGMVLDGAARIASATGPGPTKGKLHPDQHRIFGRRKDPIGG